MRRLAVVVVVGFVSSAAYAGSLWSTVDTFAFRPTGSAPGGTTYLLLGSDSRAFATSAADRARYGGTDRTPGQRADVIIAVRVLDDGSARVLTISRDLLVSGPEGGLTRVSETFSGGPQAVADALCRSIGLGVDHLLVLQLDGLRRLVDAVGGLEVDLDAPVRDLDSGLSLRSGRVHLDGNAAIAYVGSRHLEHRRPDGTWAASDDAGDRPGRAVQVLRLLGERVGVSVAAPVQSNRVLWALARSVTTDEGVGVSEVDALHAATADLGRVDPMRLPMRTVGGGVPVDQLETGAGARLAAFEGGRPRKDCARPTLATAKR